MKPPAFQFYADDFLAGVADMTQAEVGAYVLLLCHQWNRGSAPVEPERQQLLAKGSVSAHVLAKFKLQEDGTLKNERLEREREKQARYRASQSEKGLRSAESRREPRLNHGLNNGSTAVQPSVNPPSPSPSPSNTPIVPSDTLTIYEAYPRKVGRDAALKAIAKAQKQLPAADLLAKVKAYAYATARWSDDDRKFIPHPATWFNRGSYHDDPATWARSTSAQTEIRTRVLDLS
jgi:uncharacterized protein YdaU (DUF1376 family)